MGGRYIGSTNAVIRSRIMIYTTKPLRLELRKYLETTCGPICRGCQGSRCYLTSARAANSSMLLSLTEIEKCTKASGKHQSFIVDATFKCYNRHGDIVLSMIVTASQRPVAPRAPATMSNRRSRYCVPQCTSASQNMRPHCCRHVVQGTPSGQPCAACSGDHMQGCPCTCRTFPKLLTGQVIGRRGTVECVQAVDTPKHLGYHEGTTVVVRLECEGAPNINMKQSMRKPNRAPTYPDTRPFTIPLF